MSRSISLWVPDLPTVKLVVVSNDYKFSHLNYKFAPCLHHVRKKFYELFFVIDY